MNGADFTDDSESADEREAAPDGGADLSAAGAGRERDVGGDGRTRGESSELRAEELQLSYPSSTRPVVECESVLVPSGEITALVGPNGSGKSTLLKALSNHLEPDRGNVVLDGREIQRFDSKELARRVGLLSQENEAPGGLTVEELAYHGRYPHRGFLDPVGPDDREAVERALELAGVDGIRDQSVGNLSGGQKQLAWIAMILAQETDVLLLDEPTTYLDLHHQLRVMEVVRSLNETSGTTVAVVLHDLGQAARFADNLIAMKDGEPYDWGPPKKVVTEALLEDVFRVAASVTHGPDGPHIAPHHALE